MSSVDPERLALSWVFLNKDITPLIAADIIPDDFDDGNENGEHYKIYAWALEHYREHNESPGTDALALRNPNWRIDKPTDSVDVYIQEMRSQIKYNNLQDIVQRAGALLQDGDKDDEALAVITQGAMDLQQAIGVSTDEDITLDTEVRYKYYDDLRSNPGALRGYATGFHTVDRATGGLQPSQFVMIAGKQKSGKSTALFVIGKELNLQGAKAMVVSFEMSADEQKSRWDAIWARVNYRKLLDGRTNIDDMKLIQRAHRKMENGFPFILITDIGRTTTVSSIAAKAEKHKPDVILVDGVYLMMDDYNEPPGSPAALTNISRDLKRLAQRSTIPIVGTTQAAETKMTRSRGITSESLSFSQNFKNDVDALIGLQPADEEDEKSAEIRVMESRHGPKVRAEIIWDWDTMTFEERWQTAEDEVSTGTATGGY